MKLIKILNENKYIIIIIILIIYLFFIYKRIEGFQVNERYDFKLSRLEDLMDKFIKNMLVSNKDCRGRFTKYSKCDKDCGFNSVQTRKYEILKEAEKDGKKCPYEDGYTETIDCYMERCEIGEKCEDNLDCESGNCNNGKCNEWSECSFNDLNMCDKTECKQLNDDKNFTNDEDGYYLYDNTINNCFFKTPAEIEDEEIKVYSYEYNSTAPIYKIDECYWYQKKNEEGGCKTPGNIKLKNGEPYCQDKLMGPKPNPYNMDIACTQCSLSGTPWNGSNSCDCSASGTGYENQYISTSYTGECLKINTTKINQQKYYNCSNTTFIGYSFRSSDKAAGHAKWEDKYKHRDMNNSYDPCVSISDPNYADTRPRSFYRKIVRDFDGAKLYNSSYPPNKKYNGSATEFKDLKTAQNFCNNLIYKDTITGELSRCGFLPGIGYMAGLRIGSSKQTMNASIVGNCNSAMTYNINYLYDPQPDIGGELGYQSWLPKNQIGHPYGPRSSFPLKCSNELVSKDKVCPFSLDHGYYPPGGAPPSGTGGPIKKYFEGKKQWDNSLWIPNGWGSKCETYPKPFCNYMTYWDNVSKTRFPCYYDEEKKKCNASTSKCQYNLPEYCQSAINYYNNNAKIKIINDNRTPSEISGDINRIFMNKLYGKTGLKKWTTDTTVSSVAVLPCSATDVTKYKEIHGASKHRHTAPPPPKPPAPSPCKLKKGDLCQQSVPASSNQCCPPPYKCRNCVRAGDCRCS